MIETWKPIPNYEDKYEISDLGNIRSITRQARTKGNSTRTIQGKLLKQQINHRGYSIIGLSTGKSVKTFTVHQLVGLAFIPNFIKGTQLNHIDGNKQNNALTNLESSDSSHNQLHAVRTGLKTKSGKSRFNNVTFVKNPRAKKKWAASIRHAGKSSYGWKTFDTEEQAAKHVDKLLDSIGDTERNRNFP
ncbi:HNH homing endonuclease [Vibrio phage pVco-7]|uniref:HNH homing endonuclease n=1 Tax=Vibrio phage pVco-5 TaxID=1965485 RepID=A0A1W6JUZ9_9CAUD|nr:hypothetical protein KNT61_gp088 [Vibrio phage pVco-5]ARM71076.1 hypothetical protein pVco5_088 [Vibrio phage pVco-5]